VKGKRVSPATLIRYADDFVVLHVEEGVVREAQEVIARWLRDMGLELKASKTRIGHSLCEVSGRAGFDFLGFTVRQFPAGAAKNLCNHQGLPLGFITLIKPSREAVQRQVASLRKIIADHRGAPQMALIRHLNPVIRGWSNYYSTQVSKAIFHRLDWMLTQMLLQWTYRRHQRRSRSWVIRKYWDIVLQSSRHAWTESDGRFSEEL
jgi:RNA-directed DNA polymerase